MTPIIVFSHFCFDKGIFFWILPIFSYQKALNESLLSYIYLSYPKNMLITIEGKMGGIVGATDQSKLSIPAATLFLVTE